jgi:hypothetical protein
MSWQDENEISIHIRCNGESKEVHIPLPPSIPVTSTQVIALRNLLYDAAGAVDPMSRGGADVLRALHDAYRYLNKIETDPPRAEPDPGSSVLAAQASETRSRRVTALEERMGAVEKQLFSPPY